MLTEFLTSRGTWMQVMPGVRACLFSLNEGPYSLPLQMETLHFEALFCLTGAVTLTQRNGSVLRAGSRQVLLLTDLSCCHLTGARTETPIEGILVAVDARNARDSLKAICSMLGNIALNTRQVRCWMEARSGCAVEGPTYWSRAAFADLDRLPRAERARWCVWKSVELLYLLSVSEEVPKDRASMIEKEPAFAVEDILWYMEEHLDEPLTITELSRRACLSATTFKENFRRLYGLPVHTWLRQQRMKRAADLLRESSLSVLGVAQSVGYSSASQFTASFRQHYGMTPAHYRKMSEPAQPRLFG